MIVGAHTGILTAVASKGTAGAAAAGVLSNRVSKFYRSKVEEGRARKILLKEKQQKVSVNENFSLLEEEDAFISRRIDRVRLYPKKLPNNAPQVVITGGGVNIGGTQIKIDNSPNSRDSLIGGILEQSGAVKSGGFWVGQFFSGVRRFASFRKPAAYITPRPVKYYTEMKTEPVLLSHNKMQEPFDVDIMLILVVFIYIKMLRRLYVYLKKEIKSDVQARDVFDYFYCYFQY